MGNSLHDQARNDDQSRSSCKCRSKKARSSNRGQPEMPSRQAAVQHGGDGMDGNGEGNRNVNEDIHPFRRLDLFTFGGQDDPAADNVQSQVAEQHHHIPEQHGIGSRMENHVQAADRLADIGHDEHKTHNKGGDGEEFTENGDPAEGLVIVDIIGKNKHQSSGRNTDQEGKLGNIEPP